MLLAIPNVVSPASAAQLCAKLLAADWTERHDDTGTRIATGRQLAQHTDATYAAQAEVTAALMDCAAFLSAALPFSVLPPIFTHYDADDAADANVGQPERAMCCDKASGARMRADLSCTIFLNDPAEYDGGEVEIDGKYGRASYKLPAGHMLLYPSAALHRVAPVTRGERVSCFFWLQSLVADHSARELIYDLDQSIQELSAERGKSDVEVQRLTGVYHKLVRHWAEA